MITTIIFSIIIPFQISTAQAHSGRTDATGCHTNYSTGVYHCHNGYSDSTYSNSSNLDSTSTIDYQYKDSDSNGVNDYEQNASELAENIKSMGDDDGYSDAFYETYDPETNHDFSNAEYSWYKQGYDQGYKRQEIEMLIPVARDAGYNAGLLDDKMVVPEKFTISTDVQQSYEKGFVDGQTQNWLNQANEAASTFTAISFPSDLPQSVKESAQKKYDELIQKKAYDQGYESAFQHETVVLPSIYEENSVLEEEFINGFNSNNEVKKYLDRAYNEGKYLEEYSPPTRLRGNNKDQLYRKYYEKGKLETIKKYKIGFGIVSTIIVIVVITYFVIRKKKRAIEKTG